MSKPRRGTARFAPFAQCGGCRHPRKLGLSPERSTEYRAWLDRLDADANVLQRARARAVEPREELPRRGSPRAALGPRIRGRRSRCRRRSPSALDTMALAEAVIKPTVGASGVGVERVRRGHEADAVARAFAPSRARRRLLVQEFIPEVAAGETPECLLRRRVLPRAPARSSRGRISREQPVRRAHGSRVSGWRRRSTPWPACSGCSRAPRSTPGSTACRGGAVRRHGGRGQRARPRASPGPGAADRFAEALIARLRAA